MHQKIIKTVLSLVFFFIHANLVQARDLPDFTELVNENAAAVVNISTSMKSSETGGMPPGFTMPEIPENSPFHD